jgi:hypothetical protein
MADRYWVGGSASWDATAGTKWATTSGGAGGATVPTAADNVYFTAASGTVTVTVAAGGFTVFNLDCTGFTGSLVVSGPPTIYGTVFKLSAGMTYSQSANLTFIGGTGVTQTITTAGKTLGTVQFGPSTGIFSLDGALTCSSVNILGGTFNTNNFNVTASTLVSSGTNTRVINLGSSTVTLSAAGAGTFNISDSTNLTFNAGTSQINFTSTTTSTLSGAVSGNPLTFYNVGFTGVRTTTQLPGISITGINTFNNLSFVGPSSAAVVQVTLERSNTINGTFSTSGTAGNRRIWFVTVNYGIAQTLTVNGTTNLTDADFRDIYVVGTAAPITGTRIGDLRGNSGITFPAPKTVYWRTSAGSNWSLNNWSSTIGGAASTDSFPLAQDIAAFPNTGLSSGATVTFDSAIPYTGSIDMSARTNAMTFSVPSAITVYGDWKNGSGTTNSIAVALNFSGRKTQTITSAGKAFSSASINIDSFGGTVELADAFTLAGTSFTFINGTFDTKGYAVTALGFGSNGSNPRAVKLGASTVTLSGDVSFTNPLNLTFDAGTSQINFTGTAVSINANTIAFNDVTCTASTTNSTRTLSFGGTYNNLTITPPAGTGFVTVNVNGTYTINGTLNVAGASAIRRIFFKNTSIGVQSTFTVGNLVATNCDFRDIRILGTAFGSSPAGAGDCGGNFGINFPAPKTVYWNQSNNNNWSATVWAAVSNGSPSINNFPLAQDTAIVDNSSGISLGVSIDSAWNIGTFDMSGRTSAVTLTVGTQQPVVYGNWLFGTGVTHTNTTGIITFAGRNTQTITSNGVVFGCNIGISPISSTVQLADALTLGPTRTLILSMGTFDAVSYNVTIGLFSAAGATAGTVLKMGSGTWTLAGTGTVFNISTNVNLYKGTANIILSDSSTTARTFAGSGFSYNKLTIGGTGNSTTTISGNNTFTEFAADKGVSHTIALGSTVQVFGKWSVTGGGSSPVTFTGAGASHIIAGDSVSGVDNLNLGTIGFSSSSPGAFYAGIHSTGTGNGVIKTDAPTPRTLYWVGGTGNWSDTARWSLTSGGAGGAAIPTSFDNVVFNSASSAASYTSTIDQNGGLGITQHRCNQLTIAGPASGVLTLTGISCPIMIHGSVTMPVSGLNFSYSSSITLTGSTPGKIFTTNGNQLSVGVIVNGIGCEWTVGSGYVAQAQSIAIYNGKFDFGSYTSDLQFIQIVKSAGDTDSILDLNSSILTLRSGTPLIFSSPATNNHITLPGTSQLTLSSAGVTFPYFQSGASTTYNANINTFYNVSFTNASITSHTISAPNLYNNLSFAALSTQGMKSVVISGDQTVNGTLTFSAGSGANVRHFIQSNVIGTPRTISCASCSATDVDFRDIIISGAAAPLSGTRLGNCKGNSGIVFPAAKTVYWNLTASSNWTTSNGWAATAGGTPNLTNFPLAQDTAVFTSTAPSSGNVITITTGSNIGTIDMSARTSNTMTLAVGSGSDRNIYGNWINGTGTTLTGTNTLTFAGRTPQTITSAGKTFTQDFVINTPGSSVTLQDAFVTNRGITLTAGTFDTAGYNATCGLGFISSNSNVRTLAIGSSTFTSGGTGTTAWLLTTSTNFTITGTGTINMNAATDKTFVGGFFSYSNITLNQGGAGVLTITGNNTFANITNTYKATGATTIALGTTTQRVGAFSASGESGRVLAIRGSSAAAPATIIFTGSGQATTPTTNYLNITGVRAYNLTDTWYAGANSVNNGSLGWYFAAGSTPVVVSYGNFFLLF